MELDRVGRWGFIVATVVACGDGGAADLGTAVGGGGSSLGGSAATGGSDHGGSGHGGSGNVTSTGGASTGGVGGAATGGAGGDRPLTVAECYADEFVTPLVGGPDYDQYQPIVGSHCMGTNHQDIQAVERVVFLGDSVTVGTPPTLSADYYRSQLADALASHFGIAAPGPLWKAADVFNGQSLMQSSGAFASCAKWGARTDDLLQDSSQIADCFPQGELAKTTLVVITVGGNDLSNLTQGAIDGKTQQELWDQTSAFVELNRQAIEWFYEPGRFPNGVFVVFANMYEFTDGTGDVESCDVSGLAGFDEPIPAPDELAQMVIWANEQYLKIAVDYGADMIFLLEDFCGHGFNAGDPAAPCYRGAGAETWFDLTCIHPNPTGHDHLTDMFMAVVSE
jgi:lysophospholipase L1-like esterase